MDQDLKSIIQSYKQLVAAYQLAADRLGRELEQLTTPPNGLQEHTEHLKAGEFEAQLQASLQQHQLKTDYLTTVVNEVQTSLTALKGALYILLHEGPHDSQTRHTLLTVSQQHVERLMDLMKFPVL